MLPGLCDRYPRCNGRTYLSPRRLRSLLWYVSFSFAYMPLMTMQYDLRAALYVDEEQLAREREAIAREIHSLLMK